MTGKHRRDCQALQLKEKAKSRKLTSSTRVWEFEECEALKSQSPSSVIFLPARWHLLNKPNNTTHCGSSVRMSESMEYFANHHRIFNQEATPLHVIDIFKDVNKCWRETLCVQPMCKMPLAHMPATSYKNKFMIKKSSIAKLLDVTIFGLQKVDSCRRKSYEWELCLFNDLSWQ